MRDKLVHDYDQVDARRIWEVVMTSIPELLTQVTPLLSVPPMNYLRQKDEKNLG